jgi:hypothetical protein
MIKEDAMKTWFSNKYLDAFAKSIFVFGMFHIIVLMILGFRDGEDILNIFAILDLHRFVPSLGEGPVSFILSYCFASAVYCSVFLLWTKETKKIHPDENMHGRGSAT